MLSSIDNIIAPAIELKKDMDKCQKTVKEPIKIGSRVIVELDGGKRVGITIGEHYDNSSDEVVISYLSPIGNAILGKNEGEIFEYAVGDRNFTGKVVRVQSR